jgi:hypothetical protein
VSQQRRSAPERLCWRRTPLLRTATAHGAHPPFLGRGVSPLSLLDETFTFRRSLHLHSVRRPSRRSLSLTSVQSASFSLISVQRAGQRLDAPGAARQQRVNHTVAVLAADAAHLRPRTRLRWGGAGPPRRAGAGAGPPAAGPPPPPPRTKWTRRVPHPVLIGHAASTTRRTRGAPALPRVRRSRALVPHVPETAATAAVVSN